MKNGGFIPDCKDSMRITQGKGPTPEVLQLHEPVSISKISLLAPGPTLTIMVQFDTTKTALAVLSAVFCFKKKLHATDKIGLRKKSDLQAN